jgi:hypothetical protein
LRKSCNRRNHCDRPDRRRHFRIVTSSILAALAVEASILINAAERPFRPPLPLPDSYLATFGVFGFALRPVERVTSRLSTDLGLVHVVLRKIAQLSRVAR